jgi:hypothetical protein
MMKVVNDIIKAQDALIKQYGKDKYDEMVKLMKDKSGDNLLMLKAIANDEKISSEVRLVAIATMGE